VRKGFVAAGSERKMREKSGFFAGCLDGYKFFLYICATE